MLLPKQELRRQTAKAGAETWPPPSKLFVIAGFLRQKVPSYAALVTSFQLVHVHWPTSASDPRQMVQHAGFTDIKLR